MVPDWFQCALQMLFQRERKVQPAFRNITFMCERRTMVFRLNPRAHNLQDRLLRQPMYDPTTPHSRPRELSRVLLRAERIMREPARGIK